MKLRKKVHQVKEMIEAGKKVRMTPEEVAQQILKGNALSKGLEHSKGYQELNEGQKLRAQAIVHEECLRKEQWKLSDLVGLARKIQKRLKKEFPTK